MFTHLNEGMQHLNLIQLLIPNPRNTDTRKKDVLEFYQSNYKMGRIDTKFESALKNSAAGFVLLIALDQLSNVLMK